MGITLEDRVLQYGKTQPQKNAIASSMEMLTYGELREKILCAASALKERGIDKGDIILLQAVADSDYIATYLALHILGAIVIPIDRKATVETIVDIQKKMDAVFFIASKKMLHKLERVISYEELFMSMQWKDDALNDINMEDIYDILYTTGTTGQSKGVVTTRRTVYAAIQNEIEGTNLTDTDTLLIPIPLNHSFGIGKMRAILYVGGTLVLQNGVSMVTELKSNIEKYSCTAMICVPSALQIMSNQAGERLYEVLGNLRFIEAASAPFGLELKERLAKSLPNTHILNRYGSTETPAAVYLDIKDYPEKKASIGKALSNVRIKIVNDDGEEISSSENQIGKLAIFGPMVMEGYYHEPELTQSVLRDGWLYSKDMAYIDSDGFIFLQGRDDDVINTGGKKFSPIEVEDILMKSMLVKECAIVGIPDSQKVLGNVAVLAYVSDEMDEKDIIEYLKEKVEKYKLPVKCIKLKTLPRNYMGKLERKKLREMFTE